MASPTSDPNQLVGTTCLDSSGLASLSIVLGRRGPMANFRITKHVDVAQRSAVSTLEGDTMCMMSIETLCNT